MRRASKDSLKTESDASLKIENVEEVSPPYKEYVEKPKNQAVKPALAIEIDDPNDETPDEDDISFHEDGMSLVSHFAPHKSHESFNPTPSFKHNTGSLLNDLNALDFEDEIVREGGPIV